MPMATSIRFAASASPPLGAASCSGLHDPGAGQSHLLPRDGERDHDLHDRVPTGGRPLVSGLHERPHLHRVQSGLQHTEAHATHADHRVGLAPGHGRLEELLLVVAEAFLRLLDEEGFDVGEELVQRRVEPADDNGQAVHRLQDSQEVRLLCRPQFLERRGLLVRGRGEDHPSHDGQTVVSEEHVLGTAQADTLGAEPAGVRRVVAGVRVGTNAEATEADLVGPAEQLCQLRGRLGRDERHGADDDSAFRAVDRDHVALAHDRVADAEELVGGADAQGFGPDYGRLAPASRDHRRVAHQAAPGRQDAFGGKHAVHVLGGGLVAHEDHVFAVGSRRAASSAVKQTAPTAAPGEAARPLASTVRSCRRTADAAPPRCAQRSSVAAPRRASDEMAGSSTMSTAMRNAARPVRFPTRVCSIQSLPCSMVNSVSHMSR